MKLRNRYFMAILLVTASCGSKKSDSSAASNPYVLTGNWISECTASSAGFEQVKLAISKVEISTLLVEYSDAACTTSISTLPKDDLYTIDGNNLDSTVRSNQINSDVVGQTYYTIFEIKDSLLYFGTQASVDPSKRPTEIDFTMGFKRVMP